MITHLPSGPNTAGHVPVASAQDHLFARARLPPSPEVLRDAGPHPDTSIGRWPRSDRSWLPSLFRVISSWVGRETPPRSFQEAQYGEKEFLWIVSGE